VVVLGGGPAGSSIAALLAAQGRDVLLLDRARFPRPKVCSEYTSPAALDVLDALGARAAYEAAAPSRLVGTDVYTPSGRTFRIQYVHGGERKHALAMPRDRLDALLLDNARSSGVEVREGERGGGLLMDGDEVHGVLLSRPGEADVAVEARLVVGADGLHSVVGRDVGVRSLTRLPRRLGLVAHYQGVEHAEPVCQMHVRPWGYCGIAPLSGGVSSVGMALDMNRYRGVARGPGGIFDEALGTMFPELSAMLRGGQRRGPVRGIGPIAHRASRVHGAGWALVGDAAGYLDPFTGEGIYRALRGGQLLAAAADDALRAEGRISAQSLAPYSRARREVFGPKSLVVLGVQACVSYPRLLEYVAPRLRDRHPARRLLSAVLGDYADARRALSPAFVFELLRP